MNYLIFLSLFYFRKEVKSIIIKVSLFNFCVKSVYFPIFVFSLYLFVIDEIIKLKNTPWTFQMIHFCN